MRYVESSDIRGNDDGNDGQRIEKRPKLEENFTDVDADNVRRRYIKQVHILAEILDVLEIGGRENKMSMI